MKKIHIPITSLKITLNTVILSLITGILTGLTGGLFHRCTEWATEFRNEHLYIIYLLPFAGLLIVFMYNITKLNKHPGTNCVLAGVRGEEHIPLAMAPDTFIATILTHLFGGSSGREGAALQLGGSIASQTCNLLKTDDKLKPLIIMAGMSGAFSALFGTPLTAVIFSLEVCTVGTIAYSGLMPCMISAYTAQYISGLMGNHPVRFFISDIPHATLHTVIASIGLGLLCAILGVVFCKSTKLAGNLAKKISNKYIRIFIGGLIIVVLTKAMGTYDYNGAGMNIIENAINGSAVPYAFILKIIFTAITLGVGFKGGEIIPTFFIGSTFGCIAGPLFGLAPELSAALGICSLFAAVVNCPIAALVLACELFGSNGILLFAAAVFTSFAFSGYTGLYTKQIFSFSKSTYETINGKSE